MLELQKIGSTVQWVKCLADENIILSRGKYDLKWSTRVLFWWYYDIIVHWRLFILWSSCVNRCRLPYTSPVWKFVCFMCCSFYCYKKVHLWRSQAFIWWSHHMFSRCRPPYTRPPARIDSTRGTPPPPPPSSTALSHHLVPISGLNIYSRPTYMYNQGVEPSFGKIFILWLILLKKIGGWLWHKDINI